MQRQPGGEPKKANADFDLAGKHFPQGKSGRRQSRPQPDFFVLRKQKAADKGSAAGEHMFFRCAGFPQPAVCISAARICLRANAKAARRRAEKGKRRFRLSGKALSARKKRAQAKPPAARFFCFTQTKKRRTKGPPQGACDYSPVQYCTT